jgi:trimethyllysine dioxygenase
LGSSGKPNVSASVLILKLTIDQGYVDGKFWDFSSDLAKGDTAYTTLGLGAHTDNTYFVSVLLVVLVCLLAAKRLWLQTDPCGLQLFHLLSHPDGVGGATLLVDGFYVASVLKELHPHHYTLLSRIPIPAHAAGELSSIYRPSPASGYPVLRHDPASGELMQVRWNNDDRSVMNGLGPGEVEEWYEALRIWYKLLTSPDSEYWVQLTPGTAVGSSIPPIFI